tara:strand:+ start:22 stop:528 length:507 start_codon:yes stop_codon:yes gene_type:complete
MSTLKVDTIQGKTTSGTVAMPAGHVVQSVEFARIGVVGSSLSSLLTIDSTSFADVMSKTITTKLANSKIFVSMNVVGFNGADVLRVSTKIFRDSTQINGDVYGLYGVQDHMILYAFSMLDAPSASAGTTFTYKMQAARQGGSSTAHQIGYGDSGGGSTANIILMEIAQ